MRRLLITLGLGCGRIDFDPLVRTDAAPDIAPITACSVAACPPDYLLRDGGCYRLVTGEALDWLAAELTCEADGGHLVVEDSVEEHFTIHDIAAGVPRVWVGWSDRRGPDNVFTWVVPDLGGLLQTEPCVFGVSEPDAGDADHCVAQMGTNACPDYEDLSCSLALPYVCECDGMLGDPSRY